MTQGRKYLCVPYAEKNQAKKLGAWWDAAAKQWYAPSQTVWNRCAKWQPQTPKAEVVYPPKPATKAVETAPPVQSMDDYGTIRTVSKPVQTPVEATLDDIVAATKSQGIATVSNAQDLDISWMFDHATVTSTEELRRAA